MSCSEEGGSLPLKWNGPMTSHLIPQREAKATDASRSCWKACWIISAGKEFELIVYSDRVAELYVQEDRLWKRLLE